MASYNGNFNDLIGSLAALKRRAQLTGQNVTDTDVMNIQEPFFASAREYAPTAAALAEEKRQAEERMRLEEEAAAQNRISGLVQSGVNAVGTGLTAYNLFKGTSSPQLMEDGLTLTNAGTEPGTLVKAGTAVKDFAKGTYNNLFGGSSAPVADTLNTAATSQTAGTGGELVSDAAPQILEDGVTLAEGGGSAGATTTGMTSGITGALGSVVSYAPYVGAAKILGTLTRKLTNDEGEKMDYFSRTGRIAEQADKGLFSPLQKEVGYGGSETLEDIAGIYNAIHNPAGWALERIGCIIVTACTNRNSPEVNITRQYRDKFLDDDQKRGYYCLAEKIVVPYLEKNEQARKRCKKWLVDRLIDYGAHRLKLQEKKPRLSSVIVSKSFLALIKVIGFILPEYVRENGEVY